MKKKKEGEEKRMSQEEMLLEAAQTGVSHCKNVIRCFSLIAMYCELRTLSDTLRIISCRDYEFKKFGEGFSKRRGSEEKSYCS